MMQALRVFLITLLAPIALSAQTGQFVERTFTKDGFDRRYQVYVPSSYTGETPYPVVFNIPGFANTIDFFITFIRMQEAAEAEDFLYVVAEATFTDTPFGFAPSWNAASDPAGADDFAYLEEVLLRVASEFAVDSRRFYTTGHSQGAIMNWLMACRLPGHLAAIGPVAGRLPEFLRSTCPQPETPALPVAYIHGTEDPTSPYEAHNDPFFGPIISVPDYVAQIASHNGCATTTTETDLPDLNTEDNSTVTVVAYDDCPPDKDTWLVRINNGGHYWPNATTLPPELAQFGNNNMDIDGGQFLWEFFEGFSADAPPFELINSKYNSTMGPLTEGKVLDNSFLPFLRNIQVNPAGEGISRVKLVLTGPIYWRKTDFRAPYTLFGRFRFGLNGWYLPPGDYTLTAIPYQGNQRLEPMVVNFTVSGQHPVLANWRGSWSEYLQQAEGLGALEAGAAPAMPSLRIYPNPARQRAMLQLPELQADEELELWISDLLGRRVQALAPVFPGQTQLELDRDQMGLPAGTYFVHARTSRQSWPALKLIWE